MLLETALDHLRLISEADEGEFIDVMQNIEDAFNEVNRALSRVKKEQE